MKRLLILLAAFALSGCSLLTNFGDFRAEDDGRGISPPPLDGAVAPTPDGGAPDSAAAMPSDGGVPPDSATVPPDGGSSIEPVDTGIGPVPVDAGEAPVDSGAPPVDAGPAPEVDAGPAPEVDAGSDAGVTPVDSGPVPADSGPASVDSGPPCIEDALCEDGLYCTRADRCRSGTCVGGPPRDCDDGNAMTIDTCDNSAAVCRSTPV